ncbi:MAG: hypothetical protein Q7S03_00700 [bacterium]|nr:hypothetical protein [bacterium]
MRESLKLGKPVGRWAGAYGTDQDFQKILALPTGEERLAAYYEIMGSRFPLLKRFLTDGRLHSHEHDLDRTVVEVMIRRSLATQERQSLSGVQLTDMLPREVAEELTLAMKLPTSKERLAIYDEVLAEDIRQRSIFAENQIDKLIGAGWTREEAKRIMKVASPSHVLEAIGWAKEAVEKIGNYDALICILHGAGGPNKFGRERMSDALSALGIKSPEAHSSIGFFRILTGAKQALLIRQGRKH